MKSLTWSEYFFDLVGVVKQKSKDPSTQIGCVIVGKNHEILSTGFNGMPMRVTETEERKQRPQKYSYYEHAERNAIYLAARRGTPLEGSVIYLQFYPCADCARAIIQAGIKAVYLDKRMFSSEQSASLDKRWAESMAAANYMFRDSNISVHRL